MSQPEERDKIVQRIISKSPNVLVSASDPTESCSRTTKIDVLPRAATVPSSGQRFILPKGGCVPLTQLVERDGHITAVVDNGFYSDEAGQGFLLSLDSEDFIVASSASLSGRRAASSDSCADADTSLEVASSAGGEPRRQHQQADICCVCSAATDTGQGGGGGYDVFDHTTEEGNCYSDVLVGAIGPEVWDSMQQVSSVICRACAGLVSRIDAARTQLDRDCSQLRDLHQASCGDMEVDLVGGEAAGLASLVAGCGLAVREVDTSQGVAVAGGQVQCQVLATHSLAPGPGGGGGGAPVQVLCSPLEWRRYTETRDTAALLSGCLMGAEEERRTLTLLSPRVLEDVLLELDQDGPFLCANCEKSFNKLHLLVCHIQHYHMNLDDLEEETVKEPQCTARDSAEDEGTEPEVATLDKPFQCETCGKCFGNYGNMISHVEHYHGWSRACNVAACGARLSSIAEFVTHHVRHVHPEFRIPETNSERNSVPCKCPVCKKTSLGVNRHWEHSFIHDKVARFKCPVCDRRVNKVQNLKDHIKRHLGPKSKTKKCELCDKKFCPADIYKHMKTVHGKSDSTYYCKPCGKTVPLIHKLQQHSV